LNDSMNESADPDLVAHEGVCWVCYRRKGPGQLRLYPLFGEGGLELGHSIPVHGGHRMSTINKAGLYPHLEPADSKLVSGKD
jgi:hypothetical protein